MRRFVIESLRRFRVPVLASLDGAAWVVGLFLAVGLRLDTATIAPVTTLRESSGEIPLYGTLVIGGGAAVLHCALAWLIRLHQGRNALAGFDELFALSSVVAICGSVAAVVNVLLPRQLVPSTSIVVATVLTLFLCAWPRALWRATVVQARPNRFGVVSTPVIIAGAGAAGRELAGSMQRDPRQTWRPVAFVDDDPRKKHFRQWGVGVRGTTGELRRVASLTGAETLVIAMPSVDARVISRIYESARATGLTVKVLPSVSEVLGGVSYADVRDIGPTDLLGRRPIEIDLASIAGFLTGRRVLVTGAGGSIGSELCRQIMRFSPRRLVMLDRDESALHALALSIDGRADLESPNLVLADIRDARRLREVFADHRPQVVFHAAALKHVNMLEQHPSEAIKTNVAGSLNVLQAAADVDVERFVNISTDKAADPVNVLGWSKRIAEALTADFAGRTAGSYLSVRFGNVLGTRGSVLTTFTSQIERGGPVTVTDPEVSRYFMTVNEAVQLVVQAAAIGDDGEALVLDMGEPVRIADVARQMIEHSGQDVRIVFTGLKPGEKLHEVLFGPGEDDTRPRHPLVSHVRVPPLGDRDAAELSVLTDPDSTRDRLQQVCDRLSATLLSGT